ncbi:MAG: hypothetical protein AAB472_00010 [Patescibacteria group bacterium]
MLYLFTGTDVEKVRGKAFAWSAAARKKEPSAHYLRLNAGEITRAALEDAVQSQGLFFSKMLVLLDDPFSTTDSGEITLELLPLLQESKNPIAIVAPKLLASRSKKIETVAEKVFTHDLKEKKPVRGFNGALVQALADRKGSVLWKELQKAERLGDAPEMLHGLLHWKARDLMQKGGKAWSPAEAQELSVTLIELLSSARGKDLPLSLALERFALSL